MNKIPQAEQEAAVALLRQNPGSFPGAPGVGTTRIHGRFAALTLSPFVTLNCFHWEIDFAQEFADATAHGDFWRVRIPLTQDWTGRVQGYLDRTSAALVGGTDHVTYLSRIADANSNAGLGADPAVMTLNLYANDGTFGANTQFFTGTCWAQRGQIIVPQAMVTQTVELVSAQVPAKIT